MKNPGILQGSFDRYHIQITVKDKGEESYFGSYAILLVKRVLQLSLKPILMGTCSPYHTL